MKKFWKKALGVLGVSTMLGAGLVQASPVEAEAASVPNPFAVVTLEKTYDGTGFVDGKPAPSSTFVNSNNGYFPGDNGPDDGVVSSSDYVGYELEMKIGAGRARTVEVGITLPEYLSYDIKDNPGLCVSAQGINGVFNGSTTAPACTYTVGAGQSFSAISMLTLTAKDTAGTVKENQIVTASVGLKGEGVYQKDAAEEVTVVSAPAADLLIRPSSCTVGGACSAVDYRENTGYFTVFPEVIRFQGYDNTKGGTDQTPWTADLDVYGMPNGITYSIDGQPLTLDGTILHLPETVGELRIDFVAPAGWGGIELEEGQAKDFPVHMIVPTTAFATPDYKNNGDGWEPGQGEPSGVSTYNMRNSGARAGYYYPNNDWTMFRVYKPMSGKGSIFTKTIVRSYDRSQTWWEEGNMVLGAGTNIEFGNKGNLVYRKVTEDTQIISRINAYPSENPDVVSAPGVTLIMGDTWDSAELLLNGRPVLLDEKGNPVTDYKYQIQWSSSVVSKAAISNPSDSGWFNSDPTVNAANVKSVRVKIFEVPLGTGAPEKFHLDIPQLVKSYDQASPPASFPDLMVASLVSVQTGEVLSISVTDNYVTPVGTPITRVSLTGSIAPNVVDRSNRVVKYTYKPAATGFTSTDTTLGATATITLPACLTEVDLTSSAWEVVNLQLGSGCMTGKETLGTLTVKLAQPWTVGNNYNLEKDLAELPQITFNGTASGIVLGPFTATGTWKITEVDREKVNILGSDPVALTANARDYGLTQPTLSTSTPKVEVGDPLRFSASFVAKPLGASSLAADTILILPGRGNDADYLDVLRAMPQGDADAYVKDGNPLTSDFNGTYVVSKVAIDEANSVPGSALYCTTKANPSMDPADYVASDWAPCTGTKMANATAMRLAQPAGLETTGVKIDIELQPTGNKIDDLYLMWLGPVYVDGDAKSMVWPVHDIVVASDLNGYVYWDQSGKGLDHQEGWPGIEGVIVHLLDSEKNPVLGKDGKPLTVVTDEDGYYEFPRVLHSGTYFTRIEQATTGTQKGKVPAQVDSTFDPDKQIDVVQTFSYKGQHLNKSALTSTEIKLGVDTTLPNVNFGFSAPDPYSDLMKNAAKVQCEGNAIQCDIAWDITIKNGGTPLDGIVQTSAGGNHSLALDSQGNVWAWGDNSYGQLGDGTSTRSTRPVQVKDPSGDGFLSGITQIASGQYYSLALDSQGNVWAWGNNYYGQLGNGTTSGNTANPLPVQVKSSDGTGSLSGITQISAGTGQMGSHSLALDSQGNVWAWGYNSYGQLGDGTYDNRKLPVQVKDAAGTGRLSGITQISAGNNHSLALDSNGNVWAWGRSGAGQLGNGDADTARYYLPVQVKDAAGTGRLSGITQISAGGDQSLALNSNGNVWAWGSNFYGQLGNETNSGTYNANPLPLQVKDAAGTGRLSGITQIAAGGNQSLSLDSQGNVWAWGYNNYGQLGNGSVSYGANPLPVQVKDPSGSGSLSDITQISTGDNHSLAVDPQGNVWAWGNNSYGQLGDANSDPYSYYSSVPVQTIPEWIPEPSEFTGTPVTLTGGKLTDSTSQEVYDLEAIIGTKVVEVSTGSSHSLALDSNGNVWAWGYNSNGQLGDGTQTNSSLPVQVKDAAGTGSLSGITQISVGGSHSLALDSQGNVWAWGDNSYGQLGDGTQTNSSLPVQVKDAAGTGSLSGITQISASGSHSLALDSNDNVWAWGFNGYGQLGDGTSGYDPHSLPTRVKDVAGGTGLLSGITQIAAGFNHSLALDSNGNVWAWGDNSYGQLGEGLTTTKHTRPVQVKDSTGTGLLSGVTQIAAGSYHSLALDSNGNMWAWGRNTEGQLGNGTTATRSTRPVQVKDAAGTTGLPSGITQISAGGSHSLALDSNGNVWAWGDNSKGQLGDGTQTNSSLPVQVKDAAGTGSLSGITQIAAGNSHSLALDSNGNVWAWGNNYFGQLGDGTGDDGDYNALSSLPVQTKLTLDRTVLPLLTESQNGDFITRYYKLPNLAPGEEVTVTLTGKVNRPNYEANSGKGLVIGNQAWESYNETERKAPILPKPNLPAYNKDKPYDYGKWVGNDSCTATPDWVVPGDQCDQVYAQVPTTDQLLGSLSGMAWFDKNHDGIKQPSEPFLANIPVTLMKGDAPMGTAFTGANGEYLFTNLIPGDDYYVSFGMPNANSGETVPKGYSWARTIQKATVPTPNQSMTSPETGNTSENPVAVVGKKLTSPLNAGYWQVNAKIDVVKGFLNGTTYESSKVVDWDTPIKVSTKITNNGLEPLNNLVFTDTTGKGKAVVWESCVFPGNKKVNINGGETSEDGATYTFPFDAALTLAVGASYTCEGELQGFSREDMTVVDGKWKLAEPHTDTVTGSGVGTISGTPVYDDSSFTATTDPKAVPKPGIKVTKGVLDSSILKENCTGKDKEWDNGCFIKETAVAVGEEQTIRFRITNTGNEDLVDVSMVDETTVGDAKVTGIACSIPVDPETGRTLLTVGTSTDCTGTLTIGEANVPHKNEVQAFGIGRVTEELVKGNSDFTSGTFNKPIITLPLSGGQTAILFIVLGGLAAGASVLIFRKKDLGN